MVHFQPTSSTVTQARDVPVPSQDQTRRRQRAAGRTNEQPECELTRHVTPQSPMPVLRLGSNLCSIMAHSPSNTPPALPIRVRLGS
eukprot:1107417-Rhodomonas_salina.1